MDPSSHESNKGPRRSTSRTTSGGSGQQPQRPREGRRSSGSAGPQEGHPRAETPATGETALRPMPRLGSATMSYIKDYLAKTAAVGTAPPHNLPHTCGRHYKRAPAVPPPTPGSLFTASGLLNQAMSTLKLTAKPEDPTSLPCAACEADNKAKAPYRPWTEAQSQEQSGLIHKGYEVLSRDDPDHDSSESKKLRQVVAISDSEETRSSSPEVDSSESASGSEDDDADDDKEKKSKRKDKGEGKRDSEEKKRKNKKYSLIQNRDLSPESKVRRRKSRRETKEMNAKLDELDLEFKPSCPPGTDLRRRRRDYDATDDGDGGQRGDDEKRKGG
ncbi:hypothetical protein QBC37DRAFT_407065 [Rhypophila decipiens]|uniref:Uncharacterized protein n=1 Tax=Rhypophila decipiens TaxID=261697 RepID=A0AAN7B0K7_9PEZI|nr:hypothetical protein QBC37DRAFT_407065 [Rhypophila decipiens]